MEIMPLIGGLLFFLSDSLPGLLPVPGTGMCFFIILLSGEGLFEPSQPLLMQFDPARICDLCMIHTISKDTEIMKPEIHPNDIGIIHFHHRLDLIYPIRRGPRLIIQSDGGECGPTYPLFSGY